jgi:hypothetical protein
MKLLDVITASGGRVSGGDPYLWSCYGDNAQFMEFRDTTGNGYSHCIFDTKTYDVYEIYVEVPLTTNEAEAPSQCFRWINPQVLQAYLDTCKVRNVDPNIAYDDIRHNEISSEELILEYIKDIGEGYYDNLPLPEVQQ